MANFVGTYCNRPVGLHNVVTTNGRLITVFCFFSLRRGMWSVNWEHSIIYNLYLQFIDTSLTWNLFLGLQILCLTFSLLLVTFKSKSYSVKVFLRYKKLKAKRTNISQYVQCKKGLTGLLLRFVTFKRYVLIANRSHSKLRTMLKMKYFDFVLLCFIFTLSFCFYFDFDLIFI